MPQGAEDCAGELKMFSGIIQAGACQIQKQSEEEDRHDRRVIGRGVISTIKMTCIKQYFISVPGYDI